MNTKVISLRTLSVLLLGFSSGLPLALIGSTLQAWLTTTNLSLDKIALLALAGQPYFYKFLWAAFFDRVALRWLDRRRGWIALLQLLLAISVFLLAQFDPRQQFTLLLFFAGWIAFLSASQDIVINAYQTEILENHERGFGAACSVTGYRVAMLVSGALALVFADQWGWFVTYRIMAAILLCQVMVTVFSPAVNDFRIEKKAPLTQAFTNLFAKKNMLFFFIFIILYKISDALTSTTGNSITTVFLLRELHFSLTELAFVNKLIGLFSALAGTVVAGVLLSYLRLWLALIVFLVLQALANGLFLLMVFYGKNIILLGLAVGTENFLGGMLGTAIVALIMALCKKEFAATQFAIFSALAAAPRIFFPPIAAKIVDYTNWEIYFLVSMVMAIPALLMLFFMKKDFLIVSS